MSDLIHSINGLWNVYSDGSGILSGTLLPSGGIQFSDNSKLTTASDLIHTSDTGNFVGKSQTGIYSNSFYPLNSNPSNYVTQTQTGTTLVGKGSTGEFLYNKMTGSVLLNGFFNVNTPSTTLVSISPGTSMWLSNDDYKRVIDFSGNTPNNVIGKPLISGFYIDASAVTISGKSVPLSSDLTSYVLKSDTGSFVLTSNTGSFVVSSKTGSFVTISDTRDLSFAGILSVGTQLAVSGPSTFNSDISINGNSLMIRGGGASFSGSVDISGDPVITASKTGILLAKNQTGDFLTHNEPNEVTFNKSLYLTTGFVSSNPSTSAYLFGPNNYNEINGLSTGAWVLHTRIPRTANNMFRINVKGFAYNDSSILDFSLGGYAFNGLSGNIDGLPGSVIHQALSDNSTIQYNKYLGIDENGFLALAFGDTNSVMYFYKVWAEGGITLSSQKSYLSGWYWTVETGVNFGWKDKTLVSPSIHYHNHSADQITAGTLASGRLNASAYNLTSLTVGGNRVITTIDTGNFSNSTGNYLTANSPTTDVFFNNISGNGIGLTGDIQLENNRALRSRLTSGPSIILFRYDTSNAANFGANSEIKTNGSVTLGPPSGGSVNITAFGGGKIVLTGPTTLSGNSIVTSNQTGNFVTPAQTGTLPFLNLIENRVPTFTNKIITNTIETRLSGFTDFGVEYKDVANFSHVGNNLTGGFLVVTPLPRTSLCMFKMRVHGFAYSAGKNIDFTVYGYNYNAISGNRDGYPGTIINSGILDIGNDGFTKNLGIYGTGTTGRVAISFGDPSYINNFHRFSVDVWYSRLASGDYSTGWNIIPAYTGGVSEWGHFANMANGNVITNEELSAFNYITPSQTGNFLSSSQTGILIGKNQTGVFMALNEPRAAVFSGGATFYSNPLTINSTSSLVSSGPVSFNGTTNFSATATFNSTATFNTTATLTGFRVLTLADTGLFGGGGGGGGTGIGSASNLGTGQGVYSSITSNTLNLKSLTGGNGISYSSSTNEISIGVNMSKVSAALSSDLSLDTGDFFDLAQVSLTSGTWIVNGQLHVAAPDSNTAIVGRLYSSPNVLYGANSASTFYNGFEQSGYIAMPISAIVTLTSTTTVKLQAITTQLGAVALIRPYNGTTGAAVTNATQLIALRIT